MEVQSHIEEDILSKNW